MFLKWPSPRYQFVAFSNTLANGFGFRVVDGKSPFFIGKSTINGPFSMAMLVYQRVMDGSRKPVFVNIVDVIVSFQEIRG